MKEQPIRTIEIEGRELRIPTGMCRLKTHGGEGWQYVWHSNKPGCNKFFADRKLGGALESFKQALRCVAEHPHVRGEFQRYPKERKEPHMARPPGAQKGDKQTRWTKQERAAIAEEIHNGQLLGLDFTEAARRAQRECLKAGTLKPERARNPALFGRSTMKWAFPLLEKIRERRAETLPIVEPEAVLEMEPLDNGTGREEHYPDPEEQPLPDDEQRGQEPAHATPAPQPVSWGVEEPPTPVSAWVSLGRGIGVMLGTALRQPEVQQGLTELFCLALRSPEFQGALTETLGAALSGIAPPAPQPVVNDPAAWLRAQQTLPTPVQPNGNGQAKSAMEAAIGAVGGPEAVKVKVTDYKPKVFVVGLNSHEIAEFEREFKDRLRMEFAYDNTSKDQIRQHAATAEYCFSTMPHSGSPVDAILKAQMAKKNARHHYFRIPHNKKFLREKLSNLANGMAVGGGGEL